MTEFWKSALAVDTAPAPIDPWSRLVCQDDGPLVLAALESNAAVGPWVVVDVDSGTSTVGRKLTPIADGHLRADGSGLLPTYRGLTPVSVVPEPVVGASRGVGLGTGKDAHEQTMLDLGSEVVVVGRWFRPTSKLVNTVTGEVLRRLPAEPPFFLLPAATGRARLWALGSGAVFTLDTRTWHTVSREEAPRGLAACRTPHGTVAVLGAVDVSFDESLGHALLRDVAPGGLLHKLRSPFVGPRLALLNDDLTEVTSDEASWLWQALDDPDIRGAVRLTADNAGRVVLTTAQGLTLVDSLSLQLLAQHRTSAWPAPWSGRSRACYWSGERELTVLAWT